MSRLARREWWPHLDAPDLIDYTLDEPPDHDPGIRDMTVGAARPTRHHHRIGTALPGGVSSSDLTAPPSAVSRKRGAHNHAPTPEEDAA